MAYNVSPDAPASRLDPEPGTSTTLASKPAGYRSADTYKDRAQERDSARELDRMVEDAEFTRARKDLERAFPRATVPEVSERKRRELPIPDSIRRGRSSRQRKVRSVNKHQAQSRLPAVGYTAVQNLITDPDRWNTVGEALSTARGDAQQLDVKMRSQVQRVDQAIQTAERFNDRGHILYCAVTLPTRCLRKRSTCPRPCSRDRGWTSTGTQWPPMPCTNSTRRSESGTWCSRSKPAGACIWGGRTPSTTPHTCCRAECGSRWSRPVRGDTVARTAVSADG